jgi:hypothetical protein
MGEWVDSAAERRTGVDERVSVSIVSVLDVVPLTVAHSSPLRIEVVD